MLSNCCLSYQVDAAKVIPRLPVLIFKDVAETQSNSITGIRVVGGYPASWGEFKATVSYKKNKQN